MNAVALQYMRDALWLVLVLSAPPILAATTVALVVAVAQAVTQVQEQTVQYMFKLLAVVASLFVFGSLLGASLYQFADRVFSNFGSLFP